MGNVWMVRYKYRLVSGLHCCFDIADCWFKDGRGRSGVVISLFSVYRGCYTVPVGVAVAPEKALRRRYSGAYPVLHTYINSLLFPWGKAETTERHLLRSLNTLLITHARRSSTTHLTFLSLLWDSIIFVRPSWEKTMQISVLRFLHTPLASPHSYIWSYTHAGCAS